MKARMVCWHCGGWQAVEYDDEILQVLDVVALASKVGMTVKEDAANDRYLVFCGDSCARHNRQSGRYRDRSTNQHHNNGNIISSVYVQAETV